MHNHSLWDALAAALGVDAVTVLVTDEDSRAAEREQWDDGNNYLAVAPGVILGYDRNVATNTMLRKHGSEVLEVFDGPITLDDPPQHEHDEEDPPAQRLLARVARDERRCGHRSCQRVASACANVSRAL